RRGAGQVPAERRAWPREPGRRRLTPGVGAGGAGPDGAARRAGRGHSVIAAIRPERFPWFDYTRYTFSLGLDLRRGLAGLSGHTASEDDGRQGPVVVKGSLAQQVRTAYAKIEAILEAAGLGLSDIVRVIEYVKLAAIDSYPEVERARREILGEARPTINTVGVSSLLRPEAVLEVEVIG